VGGSAHRHGRRAIRIPFSAPLASARNAPCAGFAAMTAATCKPFLTPASLQDRERRPDRLGDLLEWLADLLVEVGQQRAAVAQLGDDQRPAGREALERLGWLERSVKGIGVEAAGIHQLLQREQLI